MIEDQSYFTMSHKKLPDNNCYYSSDRGKTPDEAKYDYQTKNPSKLLVWLAISPKGITKPFFCSSKLAISQTVYLDIIKNNLEPFLFSNYRQGGYVF